MRTLWGRAGPCQDRAGPLHSPLKGVPRRFVGNPKDEVGIDKPADQAYLQLAWGDGIVPAWGE